MTMNIDAGSVRAYGRAARGVWQTSLLSWLAIVALFIAAVAMRHVVAANTDVSWLLIAGERWLDGQLLYSDILETNPPMAVLVYIPGILIARALGVSAEFVVDGLLFAAIALSLGITARILRNSSALAANQRWPFAVLAVAVLAILPVQAFGQREHIAIIELLPALAVFAVRMKRETPPAWAIAIAGLTGSGAVVQAPFRHRGAGLSRCCRFAPEIVANLFRAGEFHRGRRHRLLWRLYRSVLSRVFHGDRAAGPQRLYDRTSARPDA
jgi:hypothetical protein